jgi:hypothetical protein
MILAAYAKTAKGSAESVDDRDEGTFCREVTFPRPNREESTGGVEQPPHLEHDSMENGYTCLQWPSTQEPVRVVSKYQFRKSQI